ncbi:MAG: pentapeptide repeat-containing protein [Pseudanabaena sp. CRU_2_10]|nr:pentapeptide repeat-containing protein [Pseudanabaena sp. CRU_2_10]
MANFKHVRQVKEGVDSWNQWRQKASNAEVIDLSRTDLSNMKLSGAHLSGVNLKGVNFTNADLSHADLSNANLCEVILKTPTWMEQYLTVLTLAKLC